MSPPTIFCSLARPLTYPGKLRFDQAGLRCASVFDGFSRLSRGPDEGKCPPKFTHSSAGLLQPGLDSPEQLEADLAIIACERDHETHPPVPWGVGITGERIDPLQSAGLAR